MGDVKQALCICAGGIVGTAAALAAMTVAGVTMPVAMGIAYIVTGGSIAAAVRMDD